MGKTTLAYILARHFGYKFIELSGVDFSVKALEGIKGTKAEKSDKNKAVENQVGLFAAEPGGHSHSDEPTVVFVDEIHRLNKSQQAQFLPYVERGEWVLIGATTENPSFEVISPLLSRSQVLVLKTLTEEEQMQVLERGIKFLAAENSGFPLAEDVKKHLVQIANGDARLLLNALQATFNMYPDGKVGVEELKTALGNLHLVYDKGGDEHYDTISALHKSMRGSDPDASVYYLSRMLEAGEDPLYIARRCVRFAAEDIGNADPMALVLANAAFEATNKLGMPESDTILAQLVIYLARAAKSNEAYVAYKSARADVLRHGNLSIPLKIRNAPTKLMDDLGYGDGYKYAHDHTAEELKDEVYLPDELKGKKYTKS